MTLQYLSANYDSPLFFVCVVIQPQTFQSLNNLIFCAATGWNCIIWLNQPKTWVSSQSQRQICSRVQFLSNPCYTWAWKVPALIQPAPVGMFGRSVASCTGSALTDIVTFPPLSYLLHQMLIAVFYLFSPCSSLSVCLPGSWLCRADLSLVTLCVLARESM